MNKPRIAYLGTGLMGLPMAMNLIAAGYPVTVWNRSPEKCAPAVEAGATHAATPAEAVDGCDVVLMCLTNEKVVKTVVFGDAGIAASANPPRILVDCSTAHPTATRQLADRLVAETGCAWMDAPVSGGTPAAKAGALTFMVGGDEAHFDSVRPILETLGKNITLMGPVGAGQTTKLVNQVISGCTMTIVAEAVNLAEKAGVDANRLAAALAGGFADSKPFQLLAPRMAARNFADPLGTVAMLLKDIDMVVEFGAANDASLPMTQTTCDILNATADAGHAEEDISTLILTYSKDG